MKTPSLLYEFRDEQGAIRPVAFTDPIKILQTHKLDEVRSIFEQVEMAIQKGFYAAGFVSYEAAPAFHPKMQVHPDSALPLIWFGIFKAPASSLDIDENEDYKASDWKMDGSPQKYKEAIQQIKDAILEGHTYQVNYTERLKAHFSGSDFSFYRQLARNQQSDYSAYLNLGNYRFLSASPELFFKVKNSRLTAKPMKGTAARGRFLEEDEANLKLLKESPKEQAENLMIVDLLRNDIGRLAKSGTVQVTELFEAETYPTVHQLTSTIEADIEEDSTVFDWFQALFPCGSITGAPKISTMSYIADLEQSPREVYCGAIGFITPEKEAIFNVPIRTVIVDQQNQTATYGVGGGITWDSTSDGEYQELRTKASLLDERRPEFKLLESMKLEDGHFPLLPHHLNRITDSAHYFKFRLDLEKLQRELAECAASHPQGLHKVRVLADPDGELETSTEPVSKVPEPIRCALGANPVNSHNPFLFHKTTNRGVYEQQQSAAKGAFSVLLWNEREELTEFTIGNLVLEQDGKFFTPPVDSGLLAGTYRQALLNERKIEEKVLFINDLENADAIWFINSVRGWLKVKMS